MIARNGRRGGWALPLCIAALFILYFLLAAYQKRHAGRPRFVPDTTLIEELAEATILEDEPPDPAAGWPQWRGLHRDGVVHQSDLLTAWPNRTPRRLWRADLGDGFSSMAVAGGRIWTMYRQGYQEIVVCHDADSGKEVWRFPYSCPRTHDYSGPRSTPTLDGDRLYTVGESGMLHCLDATTGKRIWARDLLADYPQAERQWGVAFSPLIEGDLVFTNPGLPNGRSIAALDKKTGMTIWEALDDPAGYSSPIAVTIDGVRQVLFFTAHSVVGVSPRDGTLYWRYSWDTSFGVNAATPLAFRARKGDTVLHYVFVSSGYEKGCVLLKIESDGAGHFTAKRVYEGNQLRSHFSSPVRHGAYIYGLDELKQLTCLDLRTGQVCWQQGGFQKGSLIRVDDYLLVLGEFGKLALVETNPNDYVEKASARVLTSHRCWTLPALANGKLYIRDEKQMLCFDVRKP